MLPGAEGAVEEEGAEMPRSPEPVRERAETEEGGLLFARTVVKRDFMFSRSRFHVPTRQESKAPVPLVVLPGGGHEDAEPSRFVFFAVVVLQLQVRTAVRVTMMSACAMTTSSVEMVRTWIARPASPQGTVSVTGAEDESGIGSQLPWLLGRYCIRILDCGYYKPL